MISIYYTLISLFIILSFILSGYNFIKNRELSLAEKILISFIISLFIYIYFSVILLFAGFYYPFILHILLIIFFLTSIKNLSFLKIVFNRIVLFIKKNKLISGFILLQLFFHWLGAVTFPLGEDALSYHLTLPKIFIQNNGFVDRPDILNSTYPLNSEIIYSLGLIFNIPEISNILNLYFYIFSIMVIYIIGIKIFGNYKISILSILIFMLTPSIIRITGYCKNDIILLFYILATFYFFFQSILRNKFKKYSVFFLMTLSVLLGIKYQALIFLFIVLISLPIVFIINKDLNLFKKSSLIILIALILSSVWYIKNYYYTGNPVFPFLNRYFVTEQSGGKSSVQEETIIEKNIKIETKTYLNPDNIRHFSYERKYKKNIVNYLKFLYDLSLNFQYFDFWKYAIGPFYLIFIFFILIDYKKINLTDSYFIGFFLLFMLAVYWLAPRGRYLLPVLPIVLLVSIKHLFNYFHHNVIKYTIIMILFISILINLGLTFSQHIFRLKYITGLQTKNDYINERLYYFRGFYDTVKYTNNNLNPDEDKILLMVNKGFLINIPYIIGYEKQFSRYIIPFRQFNNEIEFYFYINSLNISHILYIDNFKRFISNNFFQYIEKLKDNDKLEIEFNSQETYLMKLR